MKSIWKFNVPIVGNFSLSMPEGTEIIAFQVQGEKACIWGIVNQKANDVARHFTIIGTGQPFTENPGKYIGTIQEGSGFLVWHLFEIVK